MSFEEKIKALSEISKAITSDLYLEDILRVVVNVTADLLGSTICSLMLVDEKKSELVIRASQSISEQYNRKPPVKIGEGIAGRAAGENRMVVIRDVQKEKDYLHKDVARKEKLCSLCCVPMTVKGKVIGVINCYTSRPHDFTPVEMNILVTIANAAAVAIENAGLVLKSKDMEEELLTRKAVERAKGIIMKDEGLTEEQAYMRLRKFSMDNRKTMREVAEAIILTTDVKSKRKMLQ